MRLQLLLLACQPGQGAERRHNVDVVDQCAAAAAATAAVTAAAAIPTEKVAELSNAARVADAPCELRC